MTLIFELKSVMLHYSNMHIDHSVALRPVSLSVSQSNVSSPLLFYLQLY